MKKNNLLSKSLVTLSFIAGVNIPAIVNASETALIENAQQTLRISLEENLNQVVASINVNLQKDVTMLMVDNQSLDLQLASSQLNKAEKATTIIGE
ncbi:MAG: hypothetical protein ACI8WB_001791 [Phenylobacterium sp.]|jgi:hypothetical protein